MPNLLDFIFPKKCVNCGKVGDYFCEECLNEVETIDKPICAICKRNSTGGRTHFACRKEYGLDGLIVAFKYKGPVKRAISKIKYKWVYDIESVFIDELLKQFNKIDIPKLILVPVPLHAKRKNWRGFNQSEKLAGNLAKKLGTEKLELLRRTRETKPQVGLSREERNKNIRGAFSLISDYDLSEEIIILVDDVYTSGATIAECSKVLKKGGAKSVWGLVIAIG